MNPDLEINGMNSNDDRKNFFLRPKEILKKYFQFLTERKEFKFTQEKKRGGVKFGKKNNIQIRIDR